jgi:glycosyltransferase involved in cell wall biosynthesis
MKPKLLIIHNRLVIGGPALDTIPLAHHLQSDFEIHILYGCKEKDETEPSFLLNKYPELKLVNVPFLRRTPHVVNDIRAFNFISSYIKKIKPGIVHTHGAKVGFLGRVAARRNRVPLIVHTFHGHLFHSYFNRFISSLLVQLEKRLAKITNVIIAISKSQQEELTRLLTLKRNNSARVVTVPLGVDYIDTNLSNHYIQAFRRQYQFEPNTVCIGLLGRMVSIKNPIFFLDVVRYILSRAESFSVKFFIVGDGDQLPKMKDYLRTHRISFAEGEANEAVIFTSWVHNIQNILEGLDIVALTSLNEGTPLSLIEAQICGKPVVAVNVGGVNDTMIADQTGFLIQQHDIQKFGDALILLIKDKALRDQMGENARKFAVKNFSKQNEVELLRKIYLKKELN